MSVTILDSTFRLDSRRHALVASTRAGEVFFRIYDNGLRANVEAYTVRGVDYQAIGEYGCDGVFRVHSVKKTDWTQPKREATNAVHRVVSEEVQRLLAAALAAGHIRRLEAAADAWHTAERLETLERERTELLARLAEIEAERTATSKRLADLQVST